MKDKMLFDYMFSGQVLEFEIHAIMNNKDFGGNLCHPFTYYYPSVSSANVSSHL